MYPAYLTLSSGVTADSLVLLIVASTTGGEVRCRVIHIHAMESSSRGREYGYFNIPASSYL
jgi:hypothetical protein